MILLILFKIMVNALSAWLNFKGGKDWLAARRFIMPAFIALACAISTKIWWLFPAIAAPMGIMLSLSNHIRWLWCMRVAMASVCLFIFTPIAWGWYTGYVIVCSLAGLTSSWEQKVTDNITGFAFSLIIWVC